MGAVVVQCQQPNWSTSPLFPADGAEDNSPNEDCQTVIRSVKPAACVQI